MLTPPPPHTPHPTPHPQIKKRSLCFAHSSVRSAPAWDRERPLAVLQLKVKVLTAKVETKIWSVVTSLQINVYCLVQYVFTAVFKGPWHLL